MKKNEILTLYQYNAWANARILAAASQVTAEQFLAPASFGHGGLCGTLVHTLSAEWIWRNRWEGYSPSGHLPPEDFSTFDALRDRWQEEESALMAVVDNVSEEALNNSLHYQTTSGKPHEDILWQLMLHLVNHGTQHRSEAAAMLTDFGRSPGDIDLIVYLRQA
jgi:uncharacterized damage-inducible protein DinB